MYSSATAKLAARPHLACATGSRSLQDVPAEAAVMLSVGSPVEPSPAMPACECVRLLHASIVDPVEEMHSTAYRGTSKWQTSPGSVTSHRALSQRTGSAWGGVLACWGHPRDLCAVLHNHVLRRRITSARWRRRASQGSGLVQHDSLHHHVCGLRYACLCEGTFFRLRTTPRRPHKRSEQHRTISKQGRAPCRQRASPAKAS